MKRLALSLLASLSLLSCSQGADQTLAGTIGTGNTAGVAGVKLIGAGSEVGAKVYIYKSDSLAYPVDTTRTDAQGNYRFDSLPVGSYKVFLDQNGLAGAFQDIVIKEGEETKTTVELRPYVILQVDSVIGGYCGVGANVLVRAGSSTLVRIPQQQGTLSLVSGSSSNLAVAWDSVARITTLSRAGSALLQEGVAAHDGVLFSRPVSKRYDAGAISVWRPQAGGFLRVSLVFTLTESLGDTASLINFGEGLALQVNDTNLVLVDGSSRKVIGSIPRGIPQYLEMIMDGSTAKLSGVTGSVEGSMAAMLPALSSNGISNATGHLLVGNAKPSLLLQGVSIDLVNSRTKTSN